MFYAGDGQRLVAFDSKWKRDKLLDMRCSFCAEYERDARDYPQFHIARFHPGYCIGVDGTPEFRMVFDENDRCYAGIVR